MISSCPGSQKFKTPEPENITCPHCGEAVEIWTDEVEAVCQRCKNRVGRPAGQSCLDWCKYAKECVGENVYNNFMKNKIKKGGR